MSCYINNSSCKLNTPFVNPTQDDKLIYNDIYNNIQQMLIYNKFSKTKNGEYIEDNDKVTRSLAIQEYAAMVTTNYYIDVLYQYGTIFLLVILLLTFIMKANHQHIKNYVIVIVGIILSQSFTIYNKLIN